MEEFEGLTLDQLADRAAETYHGDPIHPYNQLSDLILVMLDQVDQHEADANRVASVAAERMAKILRTAIIELRIANDVSQSERDRRFFLIQGIRTIRRYMELD